MATTRLIPAAAAALAGLMMSAPSAHAIPRTFVSGAGSGAACTRAAPCATFQAAHDATDAGGEVNCVDAGEYGGVTITKSITIDCAGTVGSILAGGIGTAVTINTANVVVRLRNLNINGMVLGTAGIRFGNGAALFVENCVIAAFNSGVPGDGIGIRFAPPTGVTAQLYVTDSMVSGNGRVADGGGIVIQPAGTGTARVSIKRSHLENNTYGIFANGTGGTGSISVQVHDSVSAGSVGDGISAYTTAGAAVASITLERSSSLLNGGNGILAQGSGAFVSLADSTVMSNGTGLRQGSGGSIRSYGDNQLTGNVSDAVCDTISCTIPAEVLTLK
jgi:hypothetical protein